MSDFTLAPDPVAVRHAAEKIEDLFLMHRDDVADYTESVAVKYAEVLPQCCAVKNGQPAAEAYLLDEIRSPRADGWALYRHGCALAIPLCVAPEQRPAVAARLKLLWEKEAAPHLRIALAMALEGLR